MPWSVIGLGLLVWMVASVLLAPVMGRLLGGRPARVRITHAVAVVGPREPALAHRSAA